MSEVIEGPLIIEVERGVVTVTQAPKTARIPLSQLQRTEVVRADGNQIVVGDGQVTYQVTGWDAIGSCLVARRRS